MASKLLKTFIAFSVGFGLGLILVLINGEFIIHVPVVSSIVATGFYLTKDKWWYFWTRGID